MGPICGARLRRKRGHCARRAAKGHYRCALHGAGSCGPKTLEGRARSVAARVAGRRHWLERQRRLKATGIIVKIPGGRKPRGSPRRSADKVVARAQRLVEEMVMAKRIVPARTSSGEPALPAAKPWPAMTQAERLSANADRALDVTRQILELPVDPENPKLLGHIKEVALTVIGQQIRVSEGLRDRAAEEARGQLLLEELEERLEARGTSLHGSGSTVLRAVLPGRPPATPRDERG